jgi:hypothetical protein
MADINSTAKAAAHDRDPARRLTGDALLQSEEFVPFVLECFGRAVRRAAANEGAAVMWTQHDA